MHSRWRRRPPGCWPAELPLLLVLLAVIAELTVAMAYRARDASALDGRLTFSAFLLVCWAGLFAAVTPEMA